MTQAMQCEEAIVRSLELYVEKEGDPAAEIYSRFFARYPHAEELFGTDEDNYLKRCMMDRVFWLLLEVADGSLAPHLAGYWVTDHVSWEITQEMITDMFDIIISVFRDGIGAGWTGEMEQAWATLMAAIAPHVEREVRDSMSVKTSISTLESRREALAGVPSSACPATREITAG